MSVGIISNSSTAEEQAAALEHHGYEPGEADKFGTVEELEAARPAPEAEAVTEIPEPTKEEAVAEKAAIVEAEEGKPAGDQGSSEEEQEAAEEARQAAVMKGEQPEAFEGEKRLLKRIDKLTARLRTAETGRGELEQQLTEVREDLAKKVPAADGKTEQPVAEEVAAEPEKPVRPKRPTKAEHTKDGFLDDEAYEAALIKFEDEDLPAYEDKLSEYNRAQAVAEYQALQAQEQAEQNYRNRQQTFKAELESFGEEINGAISNAKTSAAMIAVMQNYMEPKDAALVTAYMAEHPEESERIANATLASKETLDQANPADVAEANHLLMIANRELTRLTVKAETWNPRKEKPAAAAPPKKEEPKPAAAPAKPKPPVSASAPPMEPVSARAASPAAANDISRIKTSDADALKRYEAARKAARG